MNLMMRLFDGDRVEPAFVGRLREGGARNAETPAARPRRQLRRRRRPRRTLRVRRRRTRRGGRRPLAEAGPRLSFIKASPHMSMCIKKRMARCLPWSGPTTPRKSRRGKWRSATPSGPCGRSARPGDIMRPEIAEEFRRLIKRDYRGRDPEERKFFLEEIPTFPSQ